MSDAEAFNVVIISDDDECPQDEVTFCDIDDDDDESIVNGCSRPWNHFRWLQRDTSVKLNLAGSDFSEKRIDIETVPSGRRLKSKIVKREEKSGKLFYLLNSRNQTLLCLDFSSDLKSFHIMEPESQRFIAFFTLPCFPQEEGLFESAVHIHNVIDEEIYVVDSVGSADLSIPIKSVTGEELAVIMRPPPKWTESQPGLLTLHFSGDDRGGLTCRERAVILGFFLALSIRSFTFWKRTSVGILTVYIVSAFFGCCIVLFLYMAFRNDSNSSGSTSVNGASGKYLFLPSPAS